VETGMNNDWLEDKLRQDDRYLDDAGFTARVLTTLPFQRKRRWLRPVVLTVAFVTGLLLALPAKDSFAVSFVQLLQARSLTAIPLLPVVVIGLIFWATLSAAASEN
jgi:hypothetical protein